MIINLFSVFDPSSRVGFGLNWLSMWLGLLLIPAAKWKVGSRSVRLAGRRMGLLYREVGSRSSFKVKVTFVIFLSLFIFILRGNLFGLLPYCFTSASHLVVTLRLALPLWFGYFSFGWFKRTRWILAHLIPQGTPAILIPFMVLIERVRNLIRPVTLSVRLMANMIAGHLLITLVGGATEVLVIWSLILIPLSQILLVVLERVVAAIQAYVFVVLSILYAREV